MNFTRFDIDKVLDELTLEEKIGLVSGNDSWHTYPVHRLGIPSVRVSDGPNGVRGTRFFNPVPTACIPTGTAMACSWNAELMYEVGGMMGDQARAKGAHVLMGPNINMTRNPLCGRSFESLGEDPVLSGLLATSYLKGVQDKNILLCPKHLVCNDKEDYRMTMNVSVSERALREIYLMPFMIVQKYNNPEMYMTAYNRLNGIHCSENKYLMKDIVQKEWGFKGCFVSDWYGTVSCAESINAGLHLEMPGPSIWRGKHLEMSLFHHTVREKALDDAVRGVLYVVNEAAKTGIPENADEGMHDTTEVRNIILQASRESIVLMKNENNILPLKKKGKVLVIGEAAKKTNYASGGCTDLTPYEAISLFDALGERLGVSNVDWCVGATNRRSLPSFSLFAKSGKKEPVRYCVYDDPRTFKDRKPITDEMVESIDATLGDYDPAKLRNRRQLYASFSVTINVPETGKYKICLKVSGLARLYINDELSFVNNLRHKNSSAFSLDAPEVTKEIFFEEGKDYAIEVDFESTLGKSSFITEYGSVTCGIEKAISAEQSISEAVQLAKQYDQVILITGLNKDYECEGVDRKSMDLPPFQDDLVQAVLRSNPNTVIVIESGTPVTLPWLDEAAALVHSGYIGEQLGNALVDVLFGDYNPSGKLSYTWPKKYEDCSSALSFELDHDLSLTYTDDIYMGYRHFDKAKIEPLFAFGHGLSYTTFELRALRVTVTEDTINLSIEVANIGNVGGSVVLQAYVFPQTSSIPCAKKALKGFAKIFCGQESTERATIQMDRRLALSYYDTYISEWTLERGEYVIGVGTSSDNLELFEKITIDKTVHWVNP